MMDAAKIQLSAAEMKLVSDPAWILTKNAILQKVMALMAGLSAEEQGVYEPGNLPGSQPPKISRGENYQGLPWVTLDYPRLFGREDILAIRTMFWWGHYFSVTLHLRGRYLEQYGPLIVRNRGRLGEAGFHMGISGEEWRHELAADNYSRLDEAGPEGLEKRIREHPFLKLSASCGLDQWDVAPAMLLRLFRVLVEVISSPADERGL